MAAASVAERIAAALGEGFSAVSADITDEGRLTASATPPNGKPRTVTIKAGKNTDAAVNLAVVKLKG